MFLDVGEGWPYHVIFSPASLIVMLPAQPPMPQSVFAVAGQPEVGQSGSLSMVHLFAATGKTFFIQFSFVSNRIYFS
jgi:hypothetical protein